MRPDVSPKDVLASVIPARAGVPELFVSSDQLNEYTESSAKYSTTCFGDIRVVNRKASFVTLRSESRTICTLLAALPGFPRSPRWWRCWPQSSSF